jgi:hypothetical protein
MGQQVATKEYCIGLFLLDDREKFFIPVDFTMKIGRENALNHHSIF